MKYVATILQPAATGDIGLRPQTTSRTAEFYLSFEGYDDAGNAAWDERAVEYARTLADGLGEELTEVARVVWQKG